MLTHPIETQRLLIRPFDLKDWEEVHAYTSNPNVMAYIPEGPMAEEQTKEFVIKNLDEQATAFAVILKPGNELIGHMLFHLWFAPRTYEIGWVFHQAYHGRGYATEAALALLRCGFEELQLHRLIATCQPENIPSYRVMEKVGMRREGFFQKCIYRDDTTWWSEYFYAILEEEWFRTNEKKQA